MLPIPPVNAFLRKSYSLNHRLSVVMTFLLAALVALVVFLVDAFTPLDIAVAVFYVVVVLLVASTGSRPAVLTTACTVAFLTLAGFLLSHDTDFSPTAIARCVVSLVAIGTTSILSLRNIAKTAQLHEQIDLLNLTHDAIVVYDMSGEIVFWNRGAEALYGWSAVQAVGQRVHELTQTRFPVSQSEIYAGLLSSGHWSGELQRVCRDGRLVTVTSRLALWCNAKGEPSAILATNNDVTLRKRMEDELKQKEQELRAAIDTIPGMVWSASTDGKVTFVNRRWEESGIPISVDGADLWQAVVHPEDLGGIRCDWRDAVESGRALDNLSRVRQRDGRFRWMHIAAEAQRDAGGAVQRWYGINTDIEERKRAAEALARSEAFLVDAQRLSRTGSIGISRGKRQMIWSSEAYRIFGYEPGPDIVPSLELILARTHPDDHAVVAAAYRGEGGGQPLIEIEYRLLLPGGELKYIHYVARLGPPASSDLAYVGALMDVTDARQTQQALARSMAELAHVTRITTLGELAASIAHEVAQPMAAVMTSGDAAMRWLRRDLPDIEEAARSIGQMIRSAERANDIVRQIRAMAQKQPSPRRGVGVDHVVTEAIQLMSHELQRHSIRCDVHYATGAPQVYADEVQLQQVIVNLLLNSVQAITTREDGARKIAISTEIRKAGEVQIYIQDSGPGISSDDNERLFSPFFTTKANGMGMGLSICRSIVEAHGGSISAVVPTEAGASFRITLPLRTENGEIVT